MASCHERLSSDMEDGIIGHSARVLTAEEREKLEKDNTLVSDFKRNKFELEAKKNWDLFYKRNTTKFFKDRHWTTREFNELCSDIGGSSETLIILEVGCGVGNFIFPLLEQDSTLFFHACDFSPRAVQFVKENPLYNPARCNAFQCDITCDALTNHMPEDSVHLVSMIFVLSAISPDKMTAALSNIAKVLRPGGFLLFRDYGLYDYAMLRFQSGHKLSEHFYVRQDGTRAYYFSTELLMQLVSEAGLTVCECEYVQRETVNKKEGLSVPRIFVQGKFMKPNVMDDSTAKGNNSHKTSNSVIGATTDCNTDSQSTDRDHIQDTETDSCKTSQNFPDISDKYKHCQANSQNTDRDISNEGADSQSNSQSIDKDV